MGIRHKIAEYREYKSGVKHCTFNPGGPGVVRIHLVPPKFKLFRSEAYILILNGYYLLPLGYSWALMLSYFMNEVNRYNGSPISEEDAEKIALTAVKNTKRAFPSASESEISRDLDEMLDVIFAVARGMNPDAGIEKLSIRAYRKNMTAPHRMDLMISAMTDCKGRWQCNQRCIFCYAAGQKMSAARELSTEEWKQVIDKLWDAGVPMVTFTGGEPTQRGDLTELVKHAERMVTRLNTNGVNLTPSLAASLRSAGLDSVQITLYSHNEKIHNSLVGAERFADTVRGIKAAVEAGLDVSVNTPLCKKNADYQSTVAFVHSLGVRFVTVSGLILTGMAGINHGEYDLSSDELYEAVKAAKKFADERGMEIDFTSPGLIPKEKLSALSMNVPMCGACLSNMAIAPDGTVVPCQSWLTEEAGLGNILELPFNKIWNHRLAQNLRSMSEDQALSCPFRSPKGGTRV